MIAAAKDLGNWNILRLNKNQRSLKCKHLLSCPVDSLAQPSSVLMVVTVIWKLKWQQVLFACLIYRRFISCAYRSDIYNETRQNPTSLRLYLSTKMSLIFPLLTFCAQVFFDRWNLGQMQGLITKEITAMVLW